ncbi:phage portal protein [Acinetobacter baumannii]|uniref:phage portal protein n=1 Tax=Acinetobacter baumannii TaxID=470 RepID=UPI0018989767|nr:phage portal protein [Acinetobacter baumannii]EHU1449509.1 phage portal protein [Acinetobacter baumannii]MBF6813619.1 phage portal protein [Acinetobacter baumannii]MBF6914171.1 phage portal protein [Acinetobacter baumannii]MBF6974572.1 phage portal protein [Acinetobacter baumannii]MCJ9258791.1 phage portal protein [Acinetobacter baumannii]
MNLKHGESAVIDLQAEEAKQNATSVISDPARLRTLIERRHPKYEALVAHWNFMEETYNGGRKWFSSNIFRYIKEGDKEFKNRIERAYRFNHTREVVDLINKYLFKQAITRNDKDAPQCVIDFWKSATKGNLTINDFVRQVSKKTSLFGRVGIVVDRSRADMEIVSRQDEVEANLHTYSYIVEPQRLLDYSFDENGELNWILIHEIGRDDEDPFDSSGKPVNRFRLWTKQHWALYEVKEGKGKKVAVSLVDSSNHDLGEVPVILADNIIGDDQYSAPALIDDIAYLDRATANYLSNLDAIIQDQTFSQLAMPAQNLMPGEESHDKLLEMGTKRVFLYDGEGGSQPFYLSPDVKQADLLMTTINKIIGEIYHTVGLAGERTKQDNAVGIDNSSGVAKAYDFERVNALLTAKADSLETIENKIVRLVAKWNGERIDDKDSYVSYPDNFDTRGLYDEFDISARLMLIEAPDTVRRTQMEAVIDKLFPQLAKDLKEKMLKELKDWPVDPLELASQITDGTSTGQLKNRTSIKKNDDGAEDKTAAKAKNPQGNKAAKATKNNRQGQVTEQTK